MQRVMKLLSAMLPILLGGFCLYLAYQAHLSRTSKGRLKSTSKIWACKGDKPNCVSSLDSDAKFAVKPLDVSNIPLKERNTKLRRVLKQEGAKLHKVKGQLIHATFRSSIFGFVDDMVLQLDNSSDLVQIRASSRVGYSDMGKNRKRVEAIRAAMKKGG